MPARTKTKKPLPGDDEAPFKRKLIGFDRETSDALDLLAGDRMMTVQELAEEAFADLLKKHNRPVVLEHALRQSLRLMPANDRMAKKPKKKP